jgi:hypothetical protein
MKKRYPGSVVIALALAAAFVVSSHAQQTPAAGQAPPAGGAQAANATSAMKVVVVGENPEVRKLDKEGGTAVSDVNFFRVFWSPAGAGSVCVVTVKNQPNPADNLAIAIYDDQRVYDYMIKEIRSDYARATPLKGTITQTTSMTDADGFTRKETCKADKYTVEAIWKNLGQGTWSDRPMFNNTVQMSFVMVVAAGGEITINGKSAPGTWYSKGGGMGSGAYLTLNETWRR